MSPPSPPAVRQHRVRGYGWNPSPFDLNDERYTFALPARLRRSLPTRVDLRDRFRPRDQDGLGCCTGFSLAQLFDDVWVMQGLPPGRLSSPLWVYERECFVEHHVGADSGAFPRDGLEAARLEGVCSETVLPYEPGRFGQALSQAAFEDAEHYKLESYHRVPQTEVDLRGCLAAGRPFLFGFHVYESLEADAVTASGDIPIPRPGERWLGGHCVLGVGYDDALRRFHILNHWRKSPAEWWGNQGFGTIGYGHLLDPKLAGDHYTAERIASA